MRSKGSTGAELNSGNCETCRLGRGRAGYTRVCECKCRCMCLCGLLLVNADDPAIAQALNGIPESEAVIR